MWKNLALIILALMFLGCTVGHPFNYRAVNNIQLGTSTDKDVVSWLGEPDYKRRLGNGIDVYEYAYGRQYPINGLRFQYVEVQFYNGVAINKYPRYTVYSQ